MQLGLFGNLDPPTIVLSGREITPLFHYEEKICVDEPASLLNRNYLLTSL
jgi:hypothetical protein